MGSRRKRSPAVDCAGTPGCRLVAPTARFAACQCAGTGDDCGVVGEWVFWVVRGRLRGIVDAGDTVGNPGTALAGSGAHERRCGGGVLGRGHGGAQQRSDEPTGARWCSLGCGPGQHRRDRRVA